MPWFDAQLKLRELVVRFFSLLSRYAIAHPGRMLVIATLVTLSAAPGIRWLKLRTDGHALLSQSAPEVVQDQAIREQFGIKDNLVVLIRSGHGEGIFNQATLQLVRELTVEFAQLPEIGSADVMSLATEPGFRLNPRTYDIQRLLEPALTNKAELDQLRDDLRRIELYTGTLVSNDGKSTAILIGVPPGGDRTRLYQKVLDIITAKQPFSEDVAVTGAPVAEALLGIHMLEDLGVPKAWLGTSTRGGRGKDEWRMPTSFYEFRLLIARRIGLVPVVVLVMMLIFLLSFRNVTATLLPLPGVVATMLFVFGLMGWCGVPVYLTIAVMPVLLTATGVTNDIYVFNRYFTLLREKPGVSHVELVGETFDKMVAPIASTSLTTGIGFLSFGFSPLGPVQAFGIFTGIGVLFGLFYSFTVVPAMLTLINPAWLFSRPRVETPAVAFALGPWFGRLGQWVVRWRWWAAGLAIVMIAVTPFGLRRLVVQDSWIDGFDPNSDFRRATQQVNEQFYGMHLLFVSFDAPKVITGEVTASAVDGSGINFPGNLVEDLALIERSAITVAIADESPTRGDTNSPNHTVWQAQIQSAFQRGGRIFARLDPKVAPANFSEELRKAGRARFEIVIHSHLKPEILRAVADLGSFIRRRREYAVGGVLGPADYVLTTRFMTGPNIPDARRFPASAEEIKLLWHYYEAARGPKRLREVVDTNYWRSLTTVFLKDANFIDTAKLMSDIRAYEQEQLTPKGIRLGFAGDVALSQSLIRGIVTTQLQSLIWSVVGIYLVTAVLGGSLRWGFFCLLPSLLAIVIKFAVMGWAGIPLGVATSMFAAMTLGIGVNCAIHLLEGCRQARAAGATPTEALSRSLEWTGPPALINTLAMTLGFGVLMLSQVPANARLGLLLVLGLVNCFIASLLLLPVLLHWWPLKDTLPEKPKS
jgi:predicted RND superfamily exporter protein